MNKKAISPVVATALLIVVSVIAVVGFQGWFGTYSSSMFVKTEQESASTSQIGIETLVGNQLYFKNTLNENITITQIKIGNRECNITQNISTGVHPISLGDCINNLTLDSNIGDIVVITDKQIFAKKHLFKDVTISTLFFENSVFFFSFFLNNDSIQKIKLDGVLDNLNYNENLNGLVLDKNVNYFLNNGSYISSIFDANSIVNWISLNYNGFSINSDISSKFISILNGNNDDGGFKSIILDNQNILTIGRTTSYGGSDVDMILNEFDKNGNSIKTTIYGGLNNDYLEDIIKSKDKNFLITGFLGSYGSSDWDIFLAKLDNNFSIIWSKILDSTTNDQAITIHENEDETIYVAGRKNLLGPTDNDILLSKFNPNGDLLWIKSYGGNLLDYVSDFIILNNSLFLAGLTKSYGGSDYDSLLIKYDLNGEVLWSKINEGNEEESLRKIIKTYDENFVIIGYTRNYGGNDRDIFFAKLNQDGEVLWSKILDGNNDEIGFSIVEDNDNNLILIGNTLSWGSTSKDILISKFDANGNNLWSKIIGSPGDENPQSIEILFDNSILITGLSWGWGGTDSDIFLIKIDEEGNIENFDEINDITIIPNDIILNLIDISIVPVDENLISANFTLDRLNVLALSDYEIYNPLSPSINILGRFCDNEFCSDNLWENLGFNETILLNKNSQYFQYMLNLTTHNNNYSPIIYNVSIKYQN